MASCAMLNVSAVLVVSATAASVFAGFSGTMLNVPTDPSTWGFATSIATLDSSGFDYADNSGFEAVIPGSPPFILDRTDVRTDVYRVTAAQVIATSAGSITVNPNDLVFAYRLRLVNSFQPLTVGSVDEAQVVGAPDFGFGQDAMAGALINGQGFVVPGLHANVPTVGGLDDAAEFGASVDWEWPDNDAFQIDNGQFITMLMFTDPASLGVGVMNMNAPPGQPAGLVGQVQADGAPPVLIPIIPTPGAAVLGLLGTSGLLFGRRRSR